MNLFGILVIILSKYHLKKEISIFSEVNDKI